MPQYLIIDKDTEEPVDLIYIEAGLEKDYLKLNPSHELQEDIAPSDMFDEDYIDEEDEW